MSKNAHSGSKQSTCISVPARRPFLQYFSSPAQHNTVTHMHSWHCLLYWQPSLEPRHSCVINTRHTVTHMHEHRLLYQQSSLEVIPVSSTHDTQSQTCTAGIICSTGNPRWNPVIPMSSTAISAQRRWSSTLRHHHCDTRQPSLAVNI